MQATPKSLQRMAVPIFGTENGGKWFVCINFMAGDTWRECMESLWYRNTAYFRESLHIGELPEPYVNAMYASVFYVTTASVVQTVDHKYFSEEAIAVCWRINFTGLHLRCTDDYIRWMNGAASRIVGRHFGWMKSNTRTSRRMQRPFTFFWQYCCALGWFCSVTPCSRWDHGRYSKNLLVLRTV